MQLGFVVWLLAVSYGASAFGGMLGMASGIFIVPILATFGGIDIHTAITASLVSVIACSCGSAAPFLEGRLTNIRLAIVLETATTIGAVTGFLLIGIVPSSVLFLLFAGVLLVSARQMLTRRRESGGRAAPAVAVIGPADPGRWSTALRLDSTYPHEVSGAEVPYEVRRLRWGMVLMYGAGLISALLGIGSGVLKIPAMDTALRLPMKVSSATSNFMIGVTAAASAGAYFVRGEIVPGIAGPVALGSVAGALVGARLLLVIPGESIRIVFVVVLVALALQMCLAAFGVHVLGGAF
jgi:uncharacterized membrane protein YfcA